MESPTPPEEGFRRIPPAVDPGIPASPAPKRDFWWDVTTFLMVAACIVIMAATAITAVTGFISP